MQTNQSEPENVCFFKIVQNHAQKMRLEKWCRTAPVELKKVLSAQSYGHFTAALEFWSQCRILTFCRSTLQAKVGRFLRDPGDLRPLADLSWFSGDAAIAKGSWPYRPTLYKKLTVLEKLARLDYRKWTNVELQTSYKSTKFQKFYQDLVAQVN